MTSELTVHTFGQFTILRNGRPLTGLSSRTAEALLVYLMCHQQPLSRQVLADFFWDDRPASRAAANLRTVLAMMRKALGDFLIIDRYSVGFNHDCNYWLDLHELEEQLTDLQPVVRSPTPLTHADAHALQTAVNLYQGAFLAGFYLNESCGFDEWMVLTQERVRHQVDMGLRRLVTYYLEKGMYDAGRVEAARLLSIDPYYETAHRQMMWLLTRSGQRNAALDHYHTCRRLLSDELGVAPAPATTAVYNQIRALDFPPPCRLPHQSTPFVGREASVTAVSRQLSHPHCRLLSLLGPGGTGKTRLAIEAAAQIYRHQPGQFLHGVTFISLETIETVRQIPLLLAENLSVTLRGASDPLKRLLDHLRDKEMLLILDNVEHLLDQDQAETAVMLDQLLQEAPQIKLLVTSRHRLNLRDEWLFDVHGMDYPAESDPADPEQYDAPRLFLHHARRVRHDFAPAPADWRAIIRLCQILEGLPLGLELAAAWLRQSSCAGLVAQVEKQPDALTSSYHNVIDRHRSLTAVFDYSWRLLTPPEQRVLAKLTVFRGSFTLPAASAVAQADRPILQSLADKSLLRLEADGRYGMHVLLRQLAAAHLSAKEQALTNKAHAHFYAAFVREQEDSLDGPQADKLLYLMRLERPNLNAAWEWSLTHRAVSLLAQMAGGLAYLDDVQGTFKEGFERFSAVSGGWLDADDAGKELAGRCRAYQARFAYQLGSLEEADILYRESVDRLRSLRAPRALALALTHWGELARQQRDMAAARQRQDESLALFRQAEDMQGIARALLHRANLAFVTGRLHEAVQQYEEGLAICKELGSYRQTAVFLDNLGAAFMELGQYEAAEKALTEALQRRQAVNDRWGLATSNNNLGVLAGLQGQYDKAEKRYLAAADANRRLGHPFGVARALSNLGSVLVTQEKLEPAQIHLAEALTLWRQIDSEEGEADALFYLGKAAYRRGDYQEAERLLNQSVTLYRRLDHPLSLLQILTDLSIVYSRTGQPAMAGAVLAEGLKMAETAASPPALLRVVVGGAALMAYQGAAGAAAGWIEMALSHPKTTQPVRDEAVYLRQHWPEIAAANPRQQTTLDAAIAHLKQVLQEKTASGD